MYPQHRTHCKESDQFSSDFSKSSHHRSRKGERHHRDRVHESNHCSSQPTMICQQPLNGTVAVFMVHGPQGECMNNGHLSFTMSVNSPALIDKSNILIKKDKAPCDNPWLINFLAKSSADIETEYSAVLYYDCFNQRFLLYGGALNGENYSPSDCKDVVSVSCGNELVSLNRPVYIVFAKAMGKIKFNNHVMAPVNFILQSQLANVGTLYDDFSNTLLIDDTNQTFKLDGTHDAIHIVWFMTSEGPIPIQVGITGFAPTAPLQIFTGFIRLLGGSDKLMLKKNDILTAITYGSHVF